MSEHLNTIPETPVVETSSPSAEQALTAGGAGGDVTTNVKQGKVLAPARKRRGLVLPLVVLTAIGFGGYEGYQYFVEGRFLVTTDDAYVKADTAVIAAKVSGYIASVAVDNNVPVKAGDLLATIDDGDYRLALAAAQNKFSTQESTVARLDKQAEAQYSVIDQAKAQLVSAQADQERAAAAFARADALVQTGSSSRATLDIAKADRDRTNAAVTGAEAAVRSAEASLQVLKAQRVEAMSVLKELETAVAKADRDLSFTKVRAPFDGVIGNRAAQPGQFVQPGSRLMALVPLDQVYIEANFKETQLARIKPGQKADLVIDALAGRKIEGVVQGLAPASGAEFSLLPPENATGNFTKIVQRVPVRITVPADVAREGVLRPGLSVGVSVRTRDENLPKPSLISALGLDGWFGTAKAGR
jgi:membrane fusion protein (multidrug efflux system)